MRLSTVRESIARAAIIAAMCLSAIDSFAAPVTITGLFTVGKSSMPGVGPGDIGTVTVVVDNGGNSLSSQSFFQNQVTFAGVKVGTYVGVYAFPYYIIDPIFQTDAAGEVSVADFYDIDTGNSDSLGNSATLFGNGVTSLSQFGDSSTAYFLDEIPPLYSAAFAGDVPQAVPEPGMLGLLALGIGVVTILCRKRARTVGPRCVQ